MLRSWFAVALTASLFAQGGPIYIVDAAGGPGTNYTDVQTAVVAVPDGSTLLVRPGTYSTLVINGKGITILAETSFALGSTSAFGQILLIQNTQAHQRVLVRGLINAAFPQGELVRVSNAAGPVTLDGANQTIGIWFGGPLLTVTNSPQVNVRNWTIQGSESQPACGITNSSVVFEQCTLIGGAAAPSKLGGPGRPAVSANNSYVEFVHTSVLGGQGVLYLVFPPRPGGAAVAMTSSSVRAMGLSNHPIRGGTTPTVGPVPAITGSGVVRVDPAIPVTAAPTGVTLTYVPMPSLLADSALPGAVVTARRYGPPGVLCAVALSLRAPSFTVPWLPDPIWLDPQGLIVEAAGITPASGPLVVTKNVPNVATLRGFQFVWQAADLDPTGIVAVSNPSPSFVR